MPETLGPTVLITAFTLVSVSTVVVAIRFYCRYFILRSVKLHDHLMLLALILTWGIATINYYQVKFGTGVHAKDQDKSLGPLLLEGTLKSWYTYQLVYLTTLCVVKFSILAFYRHISSQRSFRIAIYALLGIIGAYTVSMVFVNAFECPNPSDAWSIEILFQGKGSCKDLHPIYYSQAGFNIASDIAILLLPMPVLYNLQMQRNKRIALIAIFSAGSVAVIASGVRIYALTIWSDPHADIPYVGANILIWSQIEINTAIISASIPSLKPLFKHAFGLTTTRSRTRPSLYYGRSYGNTNLASQKRMASHTESGLVSSASISYTPARGRMSPTMELKDIGHLGAGTELGRDKHRYARNSDEEIILSEPEAAYGPHNAHEFFTALPPANPGAPEPHDASGGGDSNHNDSNNPGLHIMRSVTIETSVQNNGHTRGGSFNRSNAERSAADPFHYPRRQRSSSGLAGYQTL